MQICHLGSDVSYQDALILQQQAADALLRGEGPETLFLLEHSPVYTIGRRPDQSSLRDPSALPHPVVETNRGGQATYHGPGQLVGYPILDLRIRGCDLHAHLRWIENTLMRLTASEGINNRPAEPAAHPATAEAA